MGDTAGEKKLTLLDISIGLILLLFGFACLYPFYNIYIYAFNEGVDAMRGALYLWPRKFTLDNIAAALSQDGIISAFRVTILRTLVGVSLTLICTSSLAYAMTKRELKGYKFFSTYFFITFMFTGGLIPFYLTIINLGLYNTFWVLALPGIYNFWFMIIFRSFFDALPQGLEESAQIDGASFWYIFVRIVMPLSLPVYATIGLFSAVYHWNDWFAGVFYVNKESLLPLQSLLQKLMNEVNMVNDAVQTGNVGDVVMSVTPYSIKLAVVVVAVTPIIMVYPFLQKYFMKGMLIGSLKG